MNEIELKLSKEDVDRIANALAELPWKDVHDLLHRIALQVQNQRKEE